MACGMKLFVSLVSGGFMLQWSLPDGVSIKEAR